MNARKKLNSLYGTGCILCAGFVGLACQSWGAFLIALATLVALNFYDGNIRPTARRKGQHG